MAKVGRNHPCPCGSGKKYKHCCLSRDEAAAAADREQKHRIAMSVDAPRASWRPIVDDRGARLDEMSNGAVDLIHVGKLDEAEQLCDRLLDDFPDLPDGHMRLGQLFRARGGRKRPPSIYAWRPPSLAPLTTTLRCRLALRLKPTRLTRRSRNFGRSRIARGCRAFPHQPCPRRPGNTSVCALVLTIE